MDNSALFCSNEHNFEKKSGNFSTIDKGLQKDILNSYSHYYFFSYSFGIETVHTSYTSVVRSKTTPNPRPKWANSIKNHKAAHTYMAYTIYKGVPPGDQIIIIII